MKDKSNQGSLPLSVSQSVWETKGIFSDHYIRTKLQQTSLWPKEEEIKIVENFNKKKKIGKEKRNRIFVSNE